MSKNQDQIWCSLLSTKMVGIEEHLPWSAFECLVHGIELVGVNGGAVVRFAGVGGEGGLGVGEQGAHEHRVSWRMRLG